MIKDEQWPVARLIPIATGKGVEAQERRAASALLAVIAAVPEFGHALFKPLGAPKGRFETFIEVPFKLEGRSIRPDGIIAISRGQKTWGAIVETKVGSAELKPDQIEAYLDLARELNFDAVLSISNHYVTSSTEYPIEVDKRKLKRVDLHHWSWVNVLTEAVVQKEHRGVTDPDQAYMLNELIRYLSDPRSGAVAFSSMGPHWTAIREGARNRTLRRGEPEVLSVAARWDDLVRYLGLELTKRLGRDVRQRTRADESVPAARQAALGRSLVETGRLYAELYVPDVAGTLGLAADLRTRQAIAFTTIDAPKQGGARRRVSWLLRQLDGSPQGLTIEAKVSRSKVSLANSLEGVQESPESLYPEKGKEIREFVLTFRENLGLKRDSGRGSFIDSVMSTAETFYRDVLQQLRPWKPPPPKLKERAEEEQEPVERVLEATPRAKSAIDRGRLEEDAPGSGRLPEE